MTAAPDRLLLMIFLARPDRLQPISAGTDRPPLVALVGCDGSGKSTVAAALLAWLSTMRPAHAAHLGIQSGAIGRQLGRLPIVGALLDRKVARKAGEARDGSRDPDPLTATVIFLFSLRRLRRFRHMLAQRRRGVMIVADRYPQRAAAGLDGPGLARVRATRGYVARLARREAALHGWMADQRPDLVIRLNVDLATALARKPDHRPDSLARKIALVGTVDLAGAPIVDLDSLAPIDDVVAKASEAIATRFGLTPPLARSARSGPPSSRTT